MDCWVSASGSGWLSVMGGIEGEKESEKEWVAEMKEKNDDGDELRLVVVVVVVMFSCICNMTC